MKTVKRLNLLFLKKYKVSRKKFITILIASILGLATMLPVVGRVPWGNIMFNLGLGPKVLKDGYYFINVTPTLPGFILVTIASIGILGGIIFIINLLKNL